MCIWSLKPLQTLPIQELQVAVKRPTITHLRLLLRVRRIGKRAVIFRLVSLLRYGQLYLIENVLEIFDSTTAAH